MTGTVRAKVFWSGGSQAIRVPKALRLETLEVKVERRGKSLLTSPVPDNEEWGGFWDRLLTLKEPVKRWKTRAAENAGKFESPARYGCLHRDPQS